MLYNEKEKLWNKENKLFSWQTSRKVNSLFGWVETISPRSFPSGKRKNRGIPLWQHHKEITGSRLSHWSTKRFPFPPPLWKHQWLSCHFSQCCGFQIQSVTLTALKHKQVCIFASRSVLLQPPRAAWSPNLRNSSGFKSEPHCASSFQGRAERTAGHCLSPLLEDTEEQPR